MVPHPPESDRVRAKRTSGTGEELYPDAHVHDRRSEKDRYEGNRTTGTCLGLYMYQIILVYKYMTYMYDCAI